MKKGPQQALFYFGGEGGFAAAVLVAGPAGLVLRIVQNRSQRFCRTHGPRDRVPVFKGQVAHARYTYTHVSTWAARDSGVALKLPPEAFAPLATRFATYTAPRRPGALGCQPGAQKSG